MYDLAIVIPSFNVAHTINFVIHQAALGLEKYFPEKKSVIFISDGGSTDGTIDVVKAYRKKIGADIIVERYRGIPGKGSAILHAFRRVYDMGVEALAMVDSDLRSIQPSWIKALVSPLIDGYDLVTPLYTRHKYDGTITNQLAYPLTKTLFSVNVRQPIGGDFGLSGDLVEVLLQDSFNELPTVRKFGIDIFITNTALAEGYNIAQADLGTKIHEAKDPSGLESMFLEVSSTQLLNAKRFRENWRIGSEVVEPPVFTAEDVWRFVQPLSIDINLNMGRLKALFSERSPIVGKYLPNNLYQEVSSIIDRILSKGEAIFSPEVWAKCVYHHLQSIDYSNYDKVVLSLHVLWVGRVVSFILDTKGLDQGEAEKKIVGDAEEFRKVFSSLIE